MIRIRFPEEVSGSGMLLPHKRPRVLLLSFMPDWTDRKSYLHSDVPSIWKSLKVRVIWYSLGAMICQVQVLLRGCGREVFLWCSDDKVDKSIFID